ncbi:MAG: DegT/DnrJ/EryC1/StrS family aminotransferase [Deltaproteobacteria bacterium]|nr:DegT/DnrJ/EryC1/StrS family aminotransferase [Deltaproteobacteria bacterium]
MPVMIPAFDLSEELSNLQGEIHSALGSVLRSGHFINGPSVKALERELADYLGCSHAIGVNSGTDALVLALRALGVGEGDEVITTPFTFFATAEAVDLVEATPVFVDIDPVTLNIDSALVERAISPRTKAIIPVHLFGYPANMTSISAVAKAHGLHIVEDAAQAFGAQWNEKKVGTMGDVGTFSFYPTKNLGAYGDGGLVVTNDASLAEKVRVLKDHGASRKYFHEFIGCNSRLDEIQAAILRIKLPHVDSWNDKRRAAAARYSEALSNLKGIECPTEAAGAKHVYHQYTVRIQNGQRDAVRMRLNEMGVGSTVYYPTPLHLLPVYRANHVRLPRAEKAASEVLSLPIWPGIKPETQVRVAEALKCALSS